MTLLESQLARRDGRAFTPGGLIILGRGFEPHPPYKTVIDWEVTVGQEETILDSVPEVKCAYTRLVATTPVEAVST